MRAAYVPSRMRALISSYRAYPLPRWLRSLLMDVRELAQKNRSKLDVLIMPRARHTAATSDTWKRRGTMYRPAAFAEGRTDELHRIMRDHPLGAIVALTTRGLDANHIPFELDATRGTHGTLQGHIARANGLWTDLADGAHVLVIFRGPQGYISPNWYPSKQETHRHVPTWNYEVVHVHGRLRVIDDLKFVRGVVARLTRRHEAGEARPWKMGDAPADYLDANLKMIVGIEVEIERLEGKRKLGQNREARDLVGAVSALQERGQAALAAAMREASDRS